MPDIKKVIKGLEVCTKPGTRGCFYDIKECPYDGNGCRMSLMRDVLALLKEQDNEIDTLKTLLLGYETGAMLKEQEKKQITLHKKHVITWGRNDEFNMRRLYEAICETLLDEGELLVARTDDHEKVEFVFYVAEGR